LVNGQFADLAVAGRMHTTSLLLPANPGRARLSLHPWYGHLPASNGRVRLSLHQGYRHRPASNGRVRLGIPRRPPPASTGRARPFLRHPSHRIPLSNTGSPLHLQYLLPASMGRARLRLRHSLLRQAKQGIALRRLSQLRFRYVLPPQTVPERACMKAKYNRLTTQTLTVSICTRQWPFHQAKSPCGNDDMLPRCIRRVEYP
jgi:hypothetical protein